MKTLDSKEYSARRLAYDKWKNDPYLSRDCSHVAFVVGFTRGWYTGYREAQRTRAPASARKRGKK